MDGDSASQLAHESSDSKKHLLVLLYVIDQEQNVQSIIGQNDKVSR